MAEISPGAVYQSTKLSIVASIGYLVLPLFFVYAVKALYISLWLILEIVLALLFIFLKFIILLNVSLMIALPIWYALAFSLCEILSNTF